MTARKNTTRRDNTKAVDATIKREDAKVGAKAEHVSPDALNEALGKTLFGSLLPSRKTVIISLVLNLAVCAIGIVASLYLANWLALVAMTLGMGEFISLVLWCFVYMIGVVASIYAGSVAARWVVTGQAATQMEAAGSWLKSKFTSTSTAIKQRVAAMRSNDNVTVH